MKSVKLFLILGVFVYGEPSIVVQEEIILNSMENDKNISMSYEFNSSLFEKLNENNSSLLEFYMLNQLNKDSLEKVDIILWTKDKQDLIIFEPSIYFPISPIRRKPAPINCLFTFCNDKNISMSYEFNFPLPQIGKRPNPIPCPFRFCNDDLNKELILLENSASFDKEGETLK